MSAQVVVLVPCHNEESTVADVVEGFRAVLPHADILVADNASTDRTAERAREAGARVLPVPHPGKGRAVRRLAEEFVGEVAILVDGDGTYDPSVAPALVHAVICEGYDLVNVARFADRDIPGAYRRGHRLGNAAISGLQKSLIGIKQRDVLSGYKGMSRRFLSSLPVRSRRFQLEVEIASHAIALDYAVTELSASYTVRPEGSSSKLSTYRDGVSIVRAILRLYRDLHPFAAFSWLAVPWLLVSLLLVARPVAEYLDVGVVQRVPSLVAGVATLVVAILLLMSGWILDRTNRLRRDMLVVVANDVERAARIAVGNPPYVQRERDLDARR